MHDGQSFKGIGRIRFKSIVSIESFINFFYRISIDALMFFMAIYISNFLIFWFNYNWLKANWFTKLRKSRASLPNTFQLTSGLNSLWQMGSILSYTRFNFLYKKAFGMSRLFAENIYLYSKHIELLLFYYYF